MSYFLTLRPLVDHFTVVCVVAWPLNRSEAGVELFLQKPPSIYVNDAVLMLISRNSHEMQGDFYHNNIHEKISPF